MHFFQKIFYTFPEKTENFSNSFPKPGKERCQKLSPGALEQDPAGCHGCGAAEAQITAADTEAQIQPTVKGGSHK